MAPADYSKEILRFFAAGCSRSPRASSRCKQYYQYYQISLSPEYTRQAMLRQSHAAVKNPGYPATFPPLVWILALCTRVGRHLAGSDHPSNVTISWVQTCLHQGNAIFLRLLPASCEGTPAFRVLSAISKYNPASHSNVFQLRRFPRSFILL